MAIEHVNTINERIRYITKCIKSPSPRWLRLLSWLYCCVFIMPPPFIMGGGGAYSITLVRTYVRTYVHPVRTKNGFRAISFEYIGVLNSYFIHRYTSIKYMSSSITDKIHQLLSELWPLISE